MLLKARRIGVSLSLAAFVALGCGGEKKAEPTPSATPTPAAAPAAEAPAATPAKPVEEVWSTTLPQNFPADVPRYSGAEVTKARVTQDGSISATFTTSDEPAKVATYYNDALAAQGWSTQRIDAPDGTLIFGDKGKRSSSVSVTTAEGKTQIDVLLIEMP
jgi:hypothetical protein